MSAERYVRVYYRILEDPKFAGVYPDDPRLATWLRLLMTADNAWPHPAPIPRSVDAAAFAYLVDVGLVDLAANDLYRIHGLDAERMRRREQGVAGGLARAATGARDGGRYTSVSPADAGQRTVYSVSPASSSKSISKSKSISTLDASRRTNGADPEPTPLADVIRGMGLSLPPIVTDPTEEPTP
jgi:hypothetical protein